MAQAQETLGPISPMRSSPTVSRRSPSSRRSTWPNNEGVLAIQRPMGGGSMQQTEGGGSYGGSVLAAAAEESAAESAGSLLREIMSTTLLDPSGIEALSALPPAAIKLALLDLLKQNAYSVPLTVAPPLPQLLPRPHEKSDDETPTAAESSSGLEPAAESGLSVPPRPRHRSNAPTTVVHITVEDKADGHAGNAPRRQPPASTLLEESEHSKEGGAPKSDAPSGAKQERHGGVPRTRQGDRRMRLSRFRTDSNESSDDDPMMISIDALALSRRVGSGGFSTTYKATWRRPRLDADGRQIIPSTEGRGTPTQLADGRNTPTQFDGSFEELEVAVKVASAGAGSLQQWRMEVHALASLDHPNVVRYLGYVASPPNFCLVLEFCVGGDLHDALHRPTPPGFVLGVSRGVAAALEYLHSRRMMHRDIKSANVLMARDADGGIAPKLTDFGVAVELPDRSVSQGEMLTAETGTYRWMAPEVIRHQPYSTGADLYSAAIVLYELVTHDLPWRGYEPLQVAAAVALENRRPPLPSGMPPPLADLIMSAWSTSPAERPSAAILTSELAKLEKTLSAEQVLADLEDEPCACSLCTLTMVCMSRVCRSTDGSTSLTATRRPTTGPTRPSSMRGCFHRQQLPPGRALEPGRPALRNSRAPRARGCCRRQRSCNGRDQLQRLTRMPTLWFNRAPSAAPASRRPRVSRAPATGS